MIGDDAEPTLTITNSSTGPGLLLGGLVLQSTASIDKANISTLEGAATEDVVTTIKKSIISSPTVATLAISGNSCASAPVLEFIDKGFVSITSVNLTGAAYSTNAFRVKVGDNYCWLIGFSDSALVGTAAFE